MNAGLQYFGKDLEAMSFANNYHQWIVDEFRRYLGDTVAEVGAGTGNFSTLLVAAGIKRLFAFEPSTNMYSLLKDKLRARDNVEIINAFYEEKAIEFENFFDSVLYVNVLEHIEDDERELQYAYKTIKPNGRILIFVPALSWLYSELDRKVGHFRRYHKQELKETVERAGFSVETLRYFDIAGIIPWYIAFVLLKRTTTEKNVSLYDTLVVPPMRALEKVIPPPVGKNLLLVGKKPDIAREPAS